MSTMSFGGSAEGILGNIPQRGGRREGVPRSSRARRGAGIVSWCHNLPVRHDTTAIADRLPQALPGGLRLQPSQPAPVGLGQEPSMDTGACGRAWLEFDEHPRLVQGVRSPPVQCSCKWERRLARWISRTPTTFPGGAKLTLRTGERKLFAAHGRTNWFSFARVSPCAPT
jgi:hypothetical protein